MVTIDWNEICSQLDLLRIYVCNTSYFEELGQTGSSGLSFRAQLDNLC